MVKSESAGSMNEEALHFRFSTASGHKTDPTWINTKISFEAQHASFIECLLLYLRNAAESPDYPLYM